MSDFVERISGYSQKRLVLLAAELNANLERIKNQASEPVAIIGMGCRFPGGAIDPESFWKLIIQGRDAISEVPPDRWNLDEFYDPDPDASGKMNTRWGGFLSGVDKFDPDFFGISPREAASMDPQQRLLLEVAWEALENACQSPDRLAGSRTGVFTGLCSNDYMVIGSANGVGSIDAYMGTGNSHSVASGRISYLLGLQGPSISIDTACSASLVAVHLACQSLRMGECRMALAGGVNLILAPDTTVFTSRARMMAPDGRCKSFDESADGYVRGEGCGMVVLKRLSDARTNGDPILAVIRGTATNQDGRSSGLTAPNGPSQVAVIKEALANGELKPDDIDLIEAHGTGTALGDPIEAHALADVFCASRKPENPLRVGSVKTNIGHAEAAAGIAGLIKVVLALQHGKIPPSLHLKKLSSHINWSGLPIGVPTAETAWNHPQGLRCAGVSSFGFSGTNAHVIVSDLPADAAAPEPAKTEATRPLHLLPLSAQTQPALAELARRYEQEFSENPGIDFADVCYTAGTARPAFKHRLAVSAANIAEAKERLAAFQRGEESVQVQTGRASGSSAPGVVFMFTGQGSQYFGMGRELFETQPVFRAELEKCAEILKPLWEKPLLDVLFGDTTLSQLLDQTQYTQPALFALEYSLAALWRSWGIEPAAVLGHSVGEYVAACVAGVFSLEDGLKLIAERGRLMATLPAGGTMAAVFADESLVAKALASCQGKVGIACLNGPGNVVISGEGAAVHAALACLKDEGIKAKQLVVSHAFHSPLMDPILDSFERVAQEVRFHEPRIAIVPNATGKMAAADLMTSPGYWRRHIRETVQFAGSIGTLHKDGFRVFLEIGPAPVLTGMARQCVEDPAMTWLPSLRKEQGAWPPMLSSLGALFLLGVNPDWRAFDRPYHRRLVTLPTYPFQRARYWLELAPPDATRKPKQAEELEDLLYVPRWVPKKSSVEPNSHTPLSGLWIVLCDQQGFGAQVCAQLRRLGAMCLCVHAGEQPSQINDCLMTVRPSNAEDLDKMLNSAALLGPAVKGIVHLWALDAADPEKANFKAVVESQTLGCASLLLLVQALDRSRQIGTPKLWLVTKGAQPVGEKPTPLSLLQAPVWGLSRTIRVEHGNIWGGLVDLDPDDSAANAAALLVRQMTGTDGEDQSAFRAGNRYVLRLDRWQKPAVKTEPVSIRPDAAYLITGGLGGIGLEVARWLVRRGARHLVLAGRTPLPPRAEWNAVSNDSAVKGRIAAVQELESLGVEVRIKAVDMGSETLVRQLIAECLSLEHTPLRGVFHAAGVTQDEALSQQTLQSLSAVLSPKVTGGWLLHRLLAEVPLDCFVLFSSASLLLNWPRVGAYSAANIFLDALAHHRHAMGLPALSVNWGAWAETGMTVKFLASRQGKQPEIAGRAGPLGAMATRQALQALEMLIDVRAVQSAVMPVNWAEWDRSYPGFTSANYLSLLATQTDGPLQEKKSHAKLRTDILSGTPSARRAQVQSYLVEQVSGILKLPAASVELDKRLSDMGLDSLMSVELKGQIDAALGVSVASARVIQGPTVVELTDCVMELLKEPEQAKATESANVPRLVQTLAEPPGGDLPALYFCYYVTSARVMAKHLSPKRPIRILQTHYDLDLQKWQEANELDITLEELAARSVAALRQAQPHGPYYLAGYCAGGNLAFEIAQQLTRQGEEVALLVLLDAFYEPGLRRISAPRIRRWGFHLKRFLRYRSDYVTLKFKRRRERKKRLLAAAQRKASGLPDPEMTEAEKTRKLYNRFIETVLRKYKGMPYGGPMVLLRGIASPDFNISESYGWEQLMTGDFRVEEMLITHAQFEEEEHLQEIAKWLDRELAAADVRLARK